MKTDLSQGGFLAFSLSLLSLDGSDTSISRRHSGSSGGPGLTWSRVKFTGRLFRAVWVSRDAGGREQDNLVYAGGVTEGVCRR
jgi:hypothetical protein